MFWLVRPVKMDVHLQVRKNVIPNLAMSNKKIQTNLIQYGVR